MFQLRQCKQFSPRTLLEKHFRYLKQLFLDEMIQEKVELIRTGFKRQVNIGRSRHRNAEVSVMQKVCIPQKFTQFCLEDEQTVSIEKRAKMRI